MPRPTRPWFRVYVEMFPDRKIRRLTASQRWIWVALLGAARESTNPPGLYVAEGVPMTHSEIAEYAAVKEREVRNALPLLIELDLIRVMDGVIWICGWDEIAGETGRPAIPLAVRRAVMERDGFACVFCGATDRLSMDHIIRYRDGGPDTVENLRVLCLPCNWRRH